MKEIKLLTKDGSYVVSVMTPKFNKGQEPKVIIWGARSFEFTDKGHYTEIFAYWAVNCPIHKEF